MINDFSNKQIACEFYGRSKSTFLGISKIYKILLVANDILEENHEYHYFPMIHKDIFV